MPVITFGYRDLVHLIGKEVPAEELISIIPMMGADFHHYDPATGELGVEFFPDRPDNYSVEGVARSLRTFLGFEKGLRHYHVTESGITLKVERSVEKVRPYVVAGVVRDVTMTDELIRSMMELQEKVHLTVGRKRQKVSVGIHDMDAVKPPFVYKAVDPESISFVPLAKEESMNMREILQRHEKGIDYAYILEGMGKYPVILDADGQVLSFPPIINGRLTTVTERTKSIFIDVTGTDLNAISGVLNIVAAAFAERGASIHSVKVEGRRKMTTPHLQPAEMRLSVKYANQWLGLGLSPEEMAGCLLRMGYDAQPEKGRLRVRVPATRMDILHPVDLVEDVAKGYGYARFGSKQPEVHSIGSERPIERTADLVRQMMVGHGYYEVTTLTLSSQREQFEAMRLPRYRGGGGPEPHHRGPRLLAHLPPAVPAGSAEEEQASRSSATDVRSRRCGHRYQAPEALCRGEHTFEGLLHRDEIPRRRYRPRPGHRFQDRGLRPSHLHTGKVSVYPGRGREGRPLRRIASRGAAVLRARISRGGDGVGPGRCHERKDDASGLSATRRQTILGPWRC